MRILVCGVHCLASTKPPNLTKYNAGIKRLLTYIR